MDNGPKPTHLWHLTGRKHFNRTISDRIEAIKWLHPLGGRSRKDIAKLLLLTLTLGVIGGYTRGSLNLTEHSGANEGLVNSKEDCTTKTGKMCPKSTAKALPPCPCSEEDKCPMEWMKKEQKNKKK